MNSLNEPKRTVESSWISVAIAFALSRGMSISEIESVTGVSSNVLINPEARLPDDILHILFKAFNKREPNVALALKFAKGAPFDSLSLAFRHAESVRELLHFFRQNGRAVTDRFCVTVTESDGSAVLSTKHPLDELDSGQVAMFSLAFLRKVLGEILSEEPELIMVESAFPQIGSIESYTEFFGCPVHFEAHQTAITFSPRTLDLPLRNSNPELFRFSCEYYSQLLERLGHKAQPNEFDKLTLSIGQNARAGIFDAESAAANANMSLRKAQRIAAAKETSVKELMTKAKLSIAKRMVLNSHITAEEIAEFLGYSNESAFRRAFKNWTGLTTTEFRAQTRADGEGNGEK